MKKLGRPSESDKLRPRQFTDIYEERDGTKTEWIWDLDISEAGPISVEVIGDGFEVEVTSPGIRNEDLPKTKRKYLNPNNGKYVGYTRARNLGLLK